MLLHVHLQVKRALPLLLSSMKAFVTLNREKKKGAAEAQENRYWSEVIGSLPNCDNALILSDLHCP